MTKFVVIMFFVIFLRTIISTLLKPGDTGLIHKSNKILNVLDDIFITLKIDKNFSISNTVEQYMYKHNLVQEALYNNHKTHKEIRDISKTNISYKIAYYITNINEVVDEMIRKENVTKPDNALNDSNQTLGENREFDNLARRFNLNFDTFTTSTPKLPSINSLDQDEGRRIFEGSSTGIKRYPFMVSVHVRGRFVCAGSLLYESLAVSAASCLMRTPDVKEQIQIRVASDYVNKNGYLINIEELIFHPEFDRTSLANNLVILRTRKALRYRKQRVVAIQYDRAATTVLKHNLEDVVILGWGRRKADEEDLSEKDRPLSEAHLEIYDFSACQYIYTRDFVTDKTFCAGFVDRGAGACNHDAGGPALVANVLVGIISFGSPQCGATEAPTVFTRLGLYDHWIDGVFQKLVQNPELTTKGQQQQHGNMSENDLRTIINIDEELKDIYRQNMFPDDILYGPIETLDDNKLPNTSYKSFLQEYPNEPRVFPDPELLASLNLPQPETPNLQQSNEMSDGYWRDYSFEHAGLPNDNKTLHNQITTLTTVPILTKNTYSNEYETQYSISTQALNEGNAESTVTNRITNYFDENNITEGLKTTTTEPETSDSTEESQQTELVESSEIKLELSEENEIESTEDNERAIVVMVDYGTTQRIDVHRKDPVYERGFKLLASKIHQAQQLV